MRRFRTARAKNNKRRSFRYEGQKEAVKWRFQLERKVSVGDLLTSLSILISLMALLFAWNQDRRLREREQANLIRTAAAETSAKLERWEEVSLSFFDEIQPIFVQTSDNFATNNYDLQATRDYLWEQLDDKRLQNQEKLLNEDMEAAYVNLYGYRANMRPILRKLMTNLKADEETMYGGLHADTQSILYLDFGNDVEQYRQGTKKYKTADMGNALRGVADQYQEEYRKSIDAELQCFQDSLASLIAKSDVELLYGNFEICASP